MLNFLRQEGVSETIIREIEDFRAKWPTAGSPSRRIPSPRYPAPDIFIMVRISGAGAVTALLCGENLRWWASGPWAKLKMALLSEFLIKNG